MNREGQGYEIDMENFPYITDNDFSEFTDNMFLTMCILSGCDYLESIKGIGLKKAYKMVAENGDNIGAIVDKISQESWYVVPEGYKKNFEKAILTFKFQLVYCPTK